MRDGNDDDFSVAIQVDNAEWKPADECATESVAHGRSDSRILSNCVDGAFHIIEKRLSQSGHRRLIESGCLVQLFPGQGK